MNRLLIVPGIALLAGGLYLSFYDSDKSGVSNPGRSITLGEPTPIDSMEIGATTVSDAVEFKVIPAAAPSADGSSNETHQPEIAASEENHSGSPGSPIETDPATPASSIEAGTSEALVSAEGDNPEDGDADDVRAVEEIKSESIGTDKQQTSDYLEHNIVIQASLYQATNDAGLSANQTARIGKIFETYLDSRSELRKGDKLIVTLDPAAGEAGNDADQVHRIEYHGAKKTLIVTRMADSLTDYEVRSENGLMRNDEISQSSMVVEEAQQQSEESTGVAVESSADNTPATGNMKRVEGVVSLSFFSAAKEAGLNAGQIERIRKILNPYINFNREMRKGDRFVVMLDGGEIHSCEYVGALKQLHATRNSQGEYKVTDKAGRDITLAESADASTQTQSNKSTHPVITQSKSQGGSDANVKSRVADKPAAKVVRNDKSKSAAKVVRNDKSKSAAKVVRNDKSKPAAKVVRNDKSKPAVKVTGNDRNKSPVKIARTEKSNSRQVTPKRSDKSNSSQQSKAEGSFWKNLGFGSSKVAGNNWKPKDRKLAKVFDKVAASGKVEKKALVRAFKYYQENNRSSGLAQTHIAIADYTKLATTKRLHIINLNTAGVTSVQVAHGRKSGPIGGRVTSTSNANGSHQTTKGFYRVGTKEGRTSTKGLPYLSVQGLESGNRLVGLPPRKGGRDIIIHTAGYVASGGRSLGCFSIRPQDKRLVFNKLKGVLFYSYVG